MSGRVIENDADMATKLAQLDELIAYAETRPDQWVYFRAGRLPYKMGIDPKGLTKQSPDGITTIYPCWRFMADNGRVKETGFTAWLLEEYKNAKELRDFDILRRLELYDGPMPQEIKV